MLSRCKSIASFDAKLEILITAFAPTLKSASDEKVKQVLQTQLSHDVNPM